MQACQPARSPAAYDPVQFDPPHASFQYLDAETVFTHVTRVWLSEETVYSYTGVMLPIMNWKHEPPYLGANRLVKAPTGSSTRANEQISMTDLVRQGIHAALEGWHGLNKYVNTQNFHAHLEMATGQMRRTRYQSEIEMRPNGGDETDMTAEAKCSRLEMPVGCWQMG